MRGGRGKGEGGVCVHLLPALQMEYNESVRGTQNRLLAPSPANTHTLSTETGSLTVTTDTDAESRR